MKLCTTCGNKIQDSVMVCPFCDHPQTGHGKTTREKHEDIPTINVKEGHPSTEEALHRLDLALRRHRQTGIPLVRVIHGWGSGGVGGAIRSACNQELLRKERRGEIRTYLSGEVYSDRTLQGREFIKKYPVLKHTLHKDRENPGISFVEL